MFDWFCSSSANILPSNIEQHVSFGEECFEYMSYLNNLGSGGRFDGYFEQRIFEEINETYEVFCLRHAIEHLDQKKRFLAIYKNDSHVVLELRKEPWSISLEDGGDDKVLK